MRHKHFGVFIITFAYPEALNEVHDKLTPLLLQYHFATVVADGHGVARPLPKDTWAIASFMSLSELTVFIKKIITIIPNFQPEIRVMTRDDYFLQAFSSQA